MGGSQRDQEISEGFGAGPLVVIAEIKKASPSAGIIAVEFGPVEIARPYAEAGADAISVLTYRPYFQGDLSYLEQIRREVTLPLLPLTQEELERLLDVAAQCHLDVLAEVHELEETGRALASEARIIGVNNRNLRTFDVSLETTEALSQEVGPDCILVSESGIHTAADADRVRSWGADAILVGEALMRSGDKADLIRQFKGWTPLP